MAEERMRILAMIEEGKVSPAEGARLLEAIRKKGERGTDVGEPTRGRCLRVKVFEGDSEQPKVNVAVPLVLGRLALKFIPRSVLESMEEEGISSADLNELIAQVEKVGAFSIVDVRDGNEKVEVLIE